MLHQSNGAMVGVIYGIIKLQLYILSYIRAEGYKFAVGVSIAM
jgi:hypothetical protein